MIKKTIKYADLEGNEISEDFFFHYTAAELYELEFSRKPTLSENVKRIIASSDVKEILAILKEIVGGAVGQRSEDGRRFIKTEEYKKEFVSSEAYSELFLEMLQNSGLAAEFISNLVPKNMDKIAQQVEAGLQDDQASLTPKEVKDDRPAWVKENRAPTKDELRKATPEQLQAAFAAKAGSKS